MKETEVEMSGTTSIKNFLMLALCKQTIKQKANVASGFTWGMWLTFVVFSQKMNNHANSILIRQ